MYKTQDAKIADKGSVEVRNRIQNRQATQWFVHYDTTPNVFKYRKDYFLAALGRLAPYLERR